MTNPEPSSGSRPPISFPFNFSRLGNLCRAAIPANADALWKTIANPTEPCTYTALMNYVQRCTDKGELLQAFGLRPASTALVATVLRRHLKYVSKIIPADGLQALSGEIILTLENLNAHLDTQQQALFQLAILILWRVLAFFDDTDTRILLIKQFSEMLVPDVLESEFRNPQRPYLKYLTFIPVEENGAQVWLALETNRKIVHVMKTGATPQDQTYELSELNCSVFANEVMFVQKDQVDPFMTFTCRSMDEGQVWKDAIEGRGDDSMLCFTQCIPFVVPYGSAAPKEFYECFRALLQADDHDFAIAIANMAATVEDRVVVAILSCGQKYGFLPSYFRQLLGEYVFAMKTTDTIFRENSALMVSCSKFLGLAEKEYAGTVVKSLEAHRDDVRQCITDIVTLSSNVSPNIAFLLSTVFRAVRRRYSNRILPLMAVGSILMLRLLAPTLTLTNATSENTQLGGKLMNAFVFAKTNKANLAEEDFKCIAKFLATLTSEKEGTLQYPVMDDDEGPLLRFCQEQTKLNFYVQERIQKRAGHPFMWTIMEVLEHILFESNEDWQETINNCDLVDNKPAQ